MLTQRLDFRWRRRGGTDLRDQHAQTLGSPVDRLVVSGHGRGRLLRSHDLVHQRIQDRVLGLRVGQKLPVQERADRGELIWRIGSRPLCQPARHVPRARSLTPQHRVLRTHCLRRPTICFSHQDLLPMTVPGLLWACTRVPT